jgi:hypothetical protein
MRVEQQAGRQAGRQGLYCPLGCGWSSRQAGRGSTARWDAGGAAGRQAGALLPAGMRVEPQKGATAVQAGSGHTRPEVGLRVKWLVEAVPAPATVKSRGRTHQA